jgi:hypothetical protein
MSAPKSLTPPAIIAARNLNKLLTALRGFDSSRPDIVIRLVNGRLMARKRVPLWHALNASLTIHPAKSADLFGVLSQPEPRRGWCPNPKFA